jgi:hypothetical protein
MTTVVYIPTDMLFAELNDFLTISELAACARVSREWNTLSKLYRTNRIINNIFSMYPTMDVKTQCMNEDGTFNMNLLREFEKNYMAIMNAIKHARFMSFSHTFDQRLFDYASESITSTTLITETICNMIVKNRIMSVCVISNFQNSYLCTPAFYALFATTYDTNRITDVNYGVAELTHITQTPAICFKKEMTNRHYKRHADVVQCLEHKWHIDELIRASYYIREFVRYFRTHAQPMTELVWNTWNTVINYFINEASEFMLNSNKLLCILERLRQDVNIAIV